MRAWWGKGMRIEGCSALDFFELNFKRAGSAVRSTPKRARGNSKQRSVVSEEARADVVIVLCVVVCVVVCLVVCLVVFVVFVVLLFVASTDDKDKEAEGKGRKEVV